MSYEGQLWWDIDATPEQKESIINYLYQNNYNPQDEEFAKNLIQLSIELKNNPSFLLEIPYTQLQKWQELVQHQVPQSIINKVRLLNINGPFGDFQIQYLEEAKGNVINLDYFSVNINSLPNNPQTGVQFSPEGFLNYIRLNINNFINTDYSEFSPSTITGMNEAQIWNSNDPLSAIIHINIPAPAGDGSVICSQYTIVLGYLQQ